MLFDDTRLAIVLIHLSNAAREREEAKYENILFFNDHRKTSILTRLFSLRLLVI